jgi:FkbM family methyltransferase
MDLIAALDRDVRRLRLLEWLRTDVALDVGANSGQYGRRLRDAGFSGRLVSFEPLEEPFRELAAVSASDSLWSCLPMALGDHDGYTTMNVSPLSWCSSILSMSHELETFAPEAAYSQQVEAPIRRLDTLWPTLVREGEHVYLKVDVQGYEMPVLEGAGEALGSVVAVELEMSLVQMYEGSWPLRDVVDYMDDHGFSLLAAECAAEDPATGRMLQLDGIFVRAPRTGRGQEPLRA